MSTGSVPSLSIDKEAPFTLFLDCTETPWNQRMARDDMDEEEYETQAARRPAGPRFGPFVTIAVAILMLFGAASRIGKTHGDGGWLDFDFLTSQRLEQERLRRQEQRTTTLVTLGAVPAPRLEQEAPMRELALRDDVLPPQREVDFYAYQEELERRQRAPAPLSMRAPLEGGREPDALETATHFDPAPEASPQQPPSSIADTYVVAQGDNWVKIGKHLGRKWQDIQKANPQAQDGLRVGMKLTIP